MIVSAPLQDLDFGQWLTTLKDNGVSEHCAMELYKDMRMFGAVVFRAEPVDDDSLAWDAFRTQMCGVLKNITTSEQVLEYLNKPLKMMYRATEQDYDDQKTPITVAKQLNANFHARQGFAEKTSLVDWLVSYARSKPGALELSWNDVHAAISNDIPKVEMESQVYSRSELIERAAQVMDECGLKSFQWPSIVGLAGKTGGKIVEAVSITNRELQQRTQWDGGVLGLNKTIHLQIGNDISGSGGYCDNIDPDNTFVCSSPATPTNVLAHEWFHALDFKLAGTGSMLSEINAPNNSENGAMRALVEGLNSYKSTEHPLENADVITTLRSNLERNWVTAGYPEGISNQLKICLDEAPTSLTNEQYALQFQRLKNFLADNKFPRNLDLHATILMSDMAVLRDSTQLLNNGQSLWIAFAQRFQDNIKNHLQNLKGYSGYFLEPSEQLAHSFEITSDGKNVGFIDPNQNLRYPTAPEQTAQKLHWKRFFASTKNWWNEQRGVAVVQSAHWVEPVQLSSRIQQKRAATKRSSNPNDLPIAAKP